MWWRKKKKKEEKVRLDRCRVWMWNGNWFGTDFSNTNLEKIKVGDVVQMDIFELKIIDIKEEERRQVVSLERVRTLDTVENMRRKLEANKVMEDDTHE